MTDEELLSEFRGGNQDAFAQLYSRKRNDIHRFLYQMSGCSSVADDLTQEVFVALFEKAETFKPERGALAGYLFGIARRVFSRWIAQKGAAGLRELPEQETAAEPGFADRIKDLDGQKLIERMRKAILTLPPLYREVLVLCDLQELSYTDAAGILDCSVGTVRSRLHRARALLCRKLQESERRSPGGKSRRERA